MYLFYFQKLKVWQQSRQLVPKIYKITKAFPQDERFSLIDQIRRSTISIPTNIAEGIGKKTNKDQARFTSISYGSLMELLSLLNVSMDLGYIDEESYMIFQKEIESIARQLNALRESQLKFKR